MREKRVKKITELMISAVMAKKGGKRTEGKVIARAECCQKRAMAHTAKPGGLGTMAKLGRSFRGGGELLFRWLVGR